MIIIITILIAELRTFLVPSASNIKCWSFHYSYNQTALVLQSSSVTLHMQDYKYLPIAVMNLCRPG